MKKKGLFAMLIMTAIPVILGLYLPGAAANPSDQPSLPVEEGGWAESMDMTLLLQPGRDDDLGNGARKAKEWIRHVGDTLLKKTELDRLVRITDDNRLECLRYEYRVMPEKKGGQDTKPAGAALSAPQSKAEEGYGISFSSQVNVDPHRVIDDIVFNVNANYFSTFLNATYEIGKNNLTLELTDTSVDEKLGIHAGILVNTNNDDTSCLFQISFDFN